MSIFYQPPQPFTGGRQPSDQTKLSPSIEIASLIGVRRAANQLIERAWLRPGDDPAYFEFAGGRQPFESVKLCPVITAVPPVIRRPENQIAAQQQEWPQPVNDPAYYVFEGGRQPFHPALLCPAISNVPVNPPQPVRDALTQILEQWWVSPSLDLNYFEFIGGQQPFASRVGSANNLAAMVSAPPLTPSLNALETVLSAWQPPDPIPTPARHISPVSQVQPSVPSSNWNDRLALVPSEVWADPYAPPQLGIKLGHAGSSSLSVDPPPKMYSVEPFAGPPFTLHHFSRNTPGVEVDSPPSPNLLEPYVIPPGLYQYELPQWILIPVARGAANYAKGSAPPGVPYSPPPVFEREPEWTLIPQSTRFDQRGGGSNQPPPPAAPELTISFLVLPREVWDPPAPLPTLPASALHTPFGAPPPSPQKPTPAWLAAVLKAWEPADPLPILPAKFQWPTPSAADVFVSTWESVVLSWWTPSDPSPTLAKQNSPAIPGQSADPPKPNADALTNQAEILSAWTPGDPPIQLGIRTLPVISPPPFYLAYTIAPQEIILSAWVPPDPPPTLPRVLPAAVTAVAVNAPIPGNQPTFGIESIIAIGWTPADPAPTLGRPFTPLPTAFVASKVPQPAHIDLINAAWAPADPLPTVFRPNWLTGISIDQPPSGGDWAQDPITMAGIFAAWWTPADPPPTLATSPQASLAKGSRVDYPPPKSYQATETILAAWQPLDPLPVLKPFYSGIGVSVDQPPIGGYWPQDPAVLATILNAWWTPPDPLPTMPTQRMGRPGWPVSPPPPVASYGRDVALAAWRDPDPFPLRETLFVQRPMATASTDNPPFRRRGDDAVLSAWVPPDPPPTLPTARFTGIAGWSIDTLPGYHPFVVTWPPDPPMPWVPFYIVQTAPRFAPKGTSPWLSAIVTAWQPPDPPPTLAGKLAPSLSAVRTDQPPRTQCSLAQLMATIATAWIAPDPLPTLGVHQATSNVGTQHLFRRRMTGSRDRVEITGQRPFIDPTASGTE